MRLRWSPLRYIFTNARRGLSSVSRERVWQGLLGIAEFWSSSVAESGFCPARQSGALQIFIKPNKIPLRSIIR